MKAILMAAGMGTRISSETNKPKSLLPLGEESLIYHTIEMLQMHDIEVVIVTGYKEHHIVHEIRGLNVKEYYNPFFRVTNSIASLWLAREELQNDDIILMNADVYLSEEILQSIINEDNEVTMFADSSRVEDGDYFFKTHDGCLVDYGKELKKSARDCEYIGVAKIKESFLPVFKEQLSKLIKDEEYNYWWENVLYQLSGDMNIVIRDTNGFFWGEVDTREDYQRILKHLKLEKVG